MAIVGDTRILYATDQPIMVPPIWVWLKNGVAMDNGPTQSVLLFENKVPRSIHWFIMMLPIEINCQFGVVHSIFRDRISYSWFDIVWYHIIYIICIICNMCITSNAWLNLLNGCSSMPLCRQATDVSSWHLELLRNLAAPTLQKGQKPGIPWCSTSKELALIDVNIPLKKALGSSHASHPVDKQTNLWSTTLGNVLTVPYLPRIRCNSLQVSACNSSCKSREDRFSGFHPGQLIFLLYDWLVVSSHP